mmetsp:Transcript_101552/g.302977  ORF Transcript_101552/g.302977 Transcript_101552/m.302977 type:complete len:200 (-) Transcript_101552:133-732(-)
MAERLLRPPEAQLTRRHCSALAFLQKGPGAEPALQDLVLPSSAGSHGRAVSSSWAVVADAATLGLGRFRGGRLRQGVAFLFAGDPPLGGNFLLPEHHFAAGLPCSSGPALFRTSFGGHEEVGQAENAKHLVHDVGTLVLHPDKWANGHLWTRIMTQLATSANFLALVLTFVAAIYHLYGYQEYKSAREQERHWRGASHD